MALADGLGHFFEFLPASDRVGGRDGNGPRLEYGTNDNDNHSSHQKQPFLRAIRPHNVFDLKPGQWTDDAAMGLCLADSILACDQLQGSHCRALFWAWWETGLNNAFYDDAERSRSVGLGGNISHSLRALQRHVKSPTATPTTTSWSTASSSSRKNDSHNDTTDDNDHDSNSNNDSPQYDIYHYKSIPPRFEPESDAQKEDAGNGSLMRLAAVPVFFASSSATISTSGASTEHKHQNLLQQMAYESSLTTHAGPIAAEACAFTASLIVACLNRPHCHDTDSIHNNNNNNNNKTMYPAKAFLDDFCQTYQRQLEKELVEQKNPLASNRVAAKQALHRLLASCEPHTSQERCWNWKNPLVEQCSSTRAAAPPYDTPAKVGLGIEQTLMNRGGTYNGYPVSDTYFGSFSLDALAMALHCVYNTSSFAEAVVRCINFLGDADTTGSICGQIAGAFYGHSSIPVEWKRKLERWDGNGGFELRAICLAVRGYEKYSLSLNEKQQQQQQQQQQHDGNANGAMGF
mmetsp:Transcript_8368/g.17967  ORF Transcript_8368/g.17967 Transcript_8368/m.17967 type:complete len:517 (+) Transcript_8368:508-2058(+)